MDVAVQGAFVPFLGVPPNTTSNVGGANVFVEDANGDPLFNFPFNLSATIGESPNPEFDALIVNASAIGTLFSVDSLKEIRDTATFCGPAGICAVQLEGLNANRIYLGRFNIQTSGSEVSVRVGGFHGTGPGITDPSQGVARLDGAIFPVAFPTPEPGLAVMLSGLMIGLILQRRRSHSN